MAPHFARCHGAFELGRLETGECDVRREPRLCDAPSAAGAGPLVPRLAALFPRRSHAGLAGTFVPRHASPRMAPRSLPLRQDSRGAIDAALAPYPPVRRWKLPAVFFRAPAGLEDAPGAPAALGVSRPSPRTLALSFAFSAQVRLSRKAPASLYLRSFRRLDGARLRSPDALGCLAGAQGSSFGDHHDLRSPSSGCIRQRSAPRRTAPSNPGTGRYPVRSPGWLSCLSPGPWQAPSPWRFWRQEAARIP